ncbi:uncharacterized protein PHACADRAFT_193408 [Phanerochaete carnosa HHB-10118-sp]|uniref:RecQ-mediated genome instability protein 1 n=1 Tax=Phanerochaete carnosa (strain HHB-10118-sp) TaxID=650164 RepID=K5WGT1_PHACS|nr:uncharacterized protein PHACADRAFT_193408 [Phanerochaete carnosa HHB-10118-sp]EKM58284.1 hypothetical protein PHACADRAFT_193408 [Phanerochaete carnosa HHB-10118-sp]
MPPPPQVVQWLKRSYSRPAVDPDWLEGCYSWIESELQLDPATDMDAILYNIETQLLQSNLEGSMLPGTGLPTNVADLNNTKLTGPTVLVEIVSMTEIGHSAFSLQNVRQARLERADLAGLADEEDEGQGGEEEGPVPKYPRSMLRFQLTDGSTVLNAIEYRRIPEFELGVTPLGYKMLLKDVSIRRGIAWLEPKNVILKGYQTQERQDMQDSDFMRRLNIRLGKPESTVVRALAPLADPAPAANSLPIAQPVPAPLAHASDNNSSTRAARPSASGGRAPLQQIGEPKLPVAGPSNSHADDEEQPRRRKVPARSPSPARKDRPVVSRYFASGSGAAKDKAKELASELQLSPHRQPALFLPESDEEHESVAKSSHPASKANKDTDWKVTLAGGDDSSEYDFDLGVDEGEMLAALDKVEKEQGRRGSSVTASSAAAPSSSSRIATSSGSRIATSGRAVQDTEIIEIDDDEGEKENVLAPTRHVRRRTAFQRSSQVVINDDDIIELSD